MIVQNPDRPEGILEFTVSGHVTGDDYEKVVIPAVEKAIAENDRVRVLMHVDSSFEGCSLPAVWDDTMVGLRHWQGFDRVAVVTSSSPIRMTMKALSFAFPCPVRVFELSELEDARRWLEEDLGTIHLRELGGNALALELIGQVDSAAYDRAADGIDAFIAAHGRIRLLVDLREFDGWQGISALSSHLSVVRDHYRAPEKVAVLGEAAWQHLAQRVFSRFVNAETRYFQGADIGDVEKWLTAA